jgi:hypothetical protein
MRDDATTRGELCHFAIFLPDVGPATPSSRNQVSILCDEGLTASNNRKKNRPQRGRLQLISSAVAGVADPGNRIRTWAHANYILLIASMKGPGPPS